MLSFGADAVNVQLAAVPTSVVVPLPVDVNGEPAGECLIINSPDTSNGVYFALATDEGGGAPRAPWGATSLTSGVGSEGALTRKHFTRLRTAGFSHIILIGTVGNEFVCIAPLEV